MSESAPVAPETNGTAPEAPEAPELPVATFEEAHPYLRRPFTAAAMQFKAQSSGGDVGKAWAMVVGYIDARLVSDRLNLVVGGRWAPNIFPADHIKGHMWCHLTVCGVTRPDIGQGEGKAGNSDALKRAAVLFGIGQSVYRLPRMYLYERDGHLKSKKKGDKVEVRLQPSGERHARGVYQEWLDVHGVRMFGEPLDHGDVIGDDPAEDVPVAPEEIVTPQETPALERPPGVPAPDAPLRQETFDPDPRISEAEAIDLIAFTHDRSLGDTRTALVEAGIRLTGSVSRTQVDRAIEALTVDQATALREALA